MFTVIVCGEALIDNIKEKYSYALRALLNKGGYTFCVWNPEGETLEQAVPELKAAVAHEAQWRAIIVQDGETFGRECIDRRNPFDFVDTTENIPDFYISDSELESPEGCETAVKECAEKILHFRALKHENYIKASQSPLTRLAIWLLGSPMQKKPSCPDWWNEKLLGDTPIDVEYFRLLDEMNLTAAEVEQYRALADRYEILSKSFLNGAMLENVPASVIAVSERTNACEDEIFNSAWKKHEDLEYVNFCDDNLYPSQMRFVICEVEYQNHIRKSGSYIQFLSFLAVLGQNEVPSGVLQPYKLYRAETVTDRMKTKATFTEFAMRLELTRRILANRLAFEKASMAEPISEEEVRRRFISNERVLVKMNPEIREGELYGEYDKIGLSTDCPDNEYNYWDEQYHSIGKSFVRYLREPRRAVKQAVREDFRSKNFVQDDLALRLNENQREDVFYRLAEEEANMVSTVTTHLFDTAKYREELDCSDKKIRKNISERMTKKKTVITALIALAAYFIGFLPLLFSSFNTAGSFTFSLVTVAVVFGLFLASGFAYIVVMRQRLVKLIKQFNAVMGEICFKIKLGLERFSKYLSHACNVMREFSVLGITESESSRQYAVLRFHYNCVEERLREVSEAFAGNIDYSLLVGREVEPFNYDFTRPEPYSYDVHYEENERKIEFMQPGNMVELPVDYIKAIKVQREEMYD
ncbi:MAG: hypothetical protein IKD04_09745 [Clostridia bacterium]|nr:hypothetical protein [Clostridia bacterium]